jgi:hypothetical protein
MAFVRNKNQGIEIPKQQGSFASGMLGSDTATGKKQSTQAGTPGGWTNIQDYLGANVGDQTNINVAKQRTGEKVAKGASEVQKQASNLTALPTASSFNQESFNKALSEDKYSDIGSGINQQQSLNQLSQLPTNEISGYAPLENEISSLNPTDFKSTMQFVGGLADSSPTYSAGQQAFDTMLLQGNEDFRSNFIPQVKQQYQQQYQQPLEQARTAREQAKKQAQQDITAGQESWKKGVQDFLTAQETEIKNRLSAQQKDYQKVQNAANIDVQKNIADYKASTGQEPPANLVRAWESAKKQATSRMAEFEGGQFLKPSENTALNEYLGRQTDTTRMQDMQALYSMLGLTPKYQQPSTNEQYSYFGGI